jgi:hypothetical protein
MRIVDSRAPTNPLVAIGGDLSASLTVEPILPEAINRLTAAIERAEASVANPRKSNDVASPDAERGRLL